jgi:hypothetical protein
VDRHHCEPDEVYQQRASDMIADWQQRFKEEPKQGQFYEDYITGIVKSQDEE